MLKLMTSQPAPEIEQRVTRMLLDVKALPLRSDAEIRAIYSHLETIRDKLSELLDRVDGKHA